MTGSASFLMVGNGEPTPVKSLPLVSMAAFGDAVCGAVQGGARISALPVREIAGERRIIGVLAFPELGELGLLSAVLPDRYPSLTLRCPAFHWFERELAEQWDVVPEGHPWLKPIRFEPGRNGRKAPGLTDFFAMEGEESHEVAVGPVHAGVIEPGHFRFLCHGETVHHLEISLGYQHRGIEKALAGGPFPLSIHHMETLSGDTTVGHATAYSRTLEALSGVKAPARAEAIRAIAAELERMANHIGDLGALAGDVGFLPTQNYCGRIRGDVLNITALLCGNRFGRGVVRPAGVGYDLDAAMGETMLRRLAEVEKDVTGAVELMFDAPSVMARLEGTGSVSAGDAEAIGLVGVAARACGLSVDARQEFSYGMYRLSQVPASTWHTGDCFARAYVRWLEVQASMAYVMTLLRELPGGATRREMLSLKPETLAVSLVEGWRGKSVMPRLRMKRGGLPSTRWWTPPFTTGSGWPWRSGGSRSPISPSATRALASPTAGMIYNHRKRNPCFGF